MMTKDESQQHKYREFDISGDLDAMAAMAHALSSKLRLQILQSLSGQHMNVNEMAEHLNVPVSTLSTNIAILEKAGLLASDIVPASRGQMKRLSRYTSMVTFYLRVPPKETFHSGEMRMPVGCYVGAHSITRTCGCAGRKGPLIPYNVPEALNLPDHYQAQLVWLRSGYLEYRFPSMPFKDHNVNRIELSFEACSETMGHNNEFKSDIFVAINGVELGIWRSPGDLGGRRGLLNPGWWPVANTQYGCLKKWAVSSEGTTLDDVPHSRVTIDDLKLSEGEYFTVRIGVHGNAEHVGGMNLFGDEFGDHAQGIILRYYYE